MVRERIPMELIQKEKARKTTFQKRKSGLMKKVYEFSTLCGVDVCLIMYAPNFEGEGIVEPETWPHDRGEVHRILEKYFNTTGDRRPKIYNVEECYKERIKKVEAEISKVHKEMLKHKYPTWDNSFNNLGVDELKMFSNMLDARIDACNKKMNMLKGDDKGKAVIAESENPYLVSYSNNHINLMPQPHLYPPFMTDQNALAFWHEFQLGQTSQPSMPHYYCQNGMTNWSAGHSSQPSMLHYGQNGMTSLDVDHKFAMVKEDGVESNQNSYYNGKIAQSDPLNYFGNSDSLPTGFQVNGFYDTHTFQPPMFNHMHERS